MDILVMFLETVGLTVLTETPVMYIGFRKDVKRLGFVRFFLYCFLVNAITNIVLNVSLLAVRSCFSIEHSVYLLILFIFEAAVFISECLMYKFAFDKKVKARRIYVVVLLANAVSLLTGFLIF